MDWIDTYMEYTKGTPTPDIFRLWAALTAISGSLERRVWIRTAKGVLYPNLYTLLVGPPGVGKNQAIDPVKDLWRRQKDLHVAPNNVTKAALIDVLNRNGRFLIRDDIPGGMAEFHTTLIGAPEFGVLLSKHDLEFISVLNEIFDNPSNYTEERRSLEGKNPDISNPQLIILAGTQPDFLASILPEEAWGMGFCSRLIMIFSSKTPQIEIFGAQLGHDKNQFDALCSGMKRMTELYGALKWSKSAQVAVQSWYDAGMAPVPTHYRLAHYIVRRLVHLLKLSMISAISRGCSLLIEDFDVERAKSWLFQAEAAMPDIFRSMMSKSDSEVIQDLHMHLWKIWAAALPHKRVPVNEEEVYRFLTERVTSDKIDKIIDIAMKSGVIIHQAGSGGWTPRPLAAAAERL